MKDSSPSRHTLVRDLFRNLPARRRWQSFVVLGMMLIGAFAELLTLGAILPFLTVVAKPDAVSSVPPIRALMGALNLEPGPDLLVALATIFCVVAVTAAGVRILLAWITQKFVFRIGYDLGVAVYSKILYQPYQYHISYSSSQVISTINKVQNVVNGVLLPLLNGISSLVIAVAILVGLIVIRPSVALSAGLGFAVIYLMVSLATKRKLRRNSKFIADAHKFRIQTVQEGVGGIRDVLIEHAQPIYIEKFSKIDTTLRDAQAANALIAVAPRFAIESLGMVLIVLLALVLSGERGGMIGALPVLGALALGSQRMLPLLQIVYNAWTQFTGNYTSFVDIIETLRLPIAAELISSSRASPLPFEHSLELKSVLFQYAKDSPLVINNISISIAKGARVGFVGKTGSGKSTVIDLIMGLLTPTQGHISVDGTRLTLGRIKAWQEQVAHVPQHIYLSDASIIENIAFGVPKELIDEERVRRAARQADIDTYIVRQPDGYETVVGERGIKLSGGQRQRIGIARALYKQSGLLVFDEATSALDDQTEASIINSINNLGRDLTVVMIAHRLSTLKGCDVIYRLADGQVVAEGTFDEVITGITTEKLESN